MRKIYFIIPLLFLVLKANAQVIPFSDPNFKSLMIGYGYAKDANGNLIEVDLNFNGQIEVSEALNVYEIAIYQNNNLPYLVSLAGIEYFTNLRKLACTDQHLSQVDCSQLIHLEEINFTYNQLVSLNVTGLIHLKKLTCSNNAITSLNTTDLISLEYLECSGNQIPALNLSNSVNLQKLSCLYNNLSSLNIAGLTHLTEVNCQTNHLPTLNLTGLTSLTDFRCGSNQMTSLSLPDSNNLTVLFCEANQLTSLAISNLPLLTNLSCSANLLSSIDLTNQINLVSLLCNDNLLTQLDVSHTNLIEFYCEYNAITSLDISNCTNMYHFTCSNNPNLNYLNLKNGNPTNYYCYLNNLPNLTYVCVDEEEYYDIYNKMQYYSGSLYFEVNSYCTFNPGGIFYTLQGNQKIDANADGCDVNDMPYPNLKFLITDGTHTGNFISNSTGDYAIPVFAATHTVTPILENPTYFTVSPSNFQVSFPTAASPHIQDFCITPNGVHNDLEVTILPLIRPRPGFDATYKIVYKNKGTSTQSGSVTFSFEEDKVDFVEATPGVSAQSAGLLTWNYSDLEPFESRNILVKVNINSPMENPPVSIGDQLDFASVINPISEDEIVFDNTKSIKQVVVGSLDPNHKTCLEGNSVGTQMIGAYVTYLIEFENTGTFAAENIVVKDMIDTAKFDINSLVPINSSHSFITRINDNKVEFIFENINLPFDDAHNDGYVAFKIKTKPTLVEGDTFENNASIYFDYNFPVVTNTTSTIIQTLGNQNFDFSTYFSLYPNPVKDFLNIQNSKAISVYSVSIYTMLGQLLQVVTNPTNTIDVAALKPGNYFITFSTDKGSTSGRFVKN